MAITRQDYKTIKNTLVGLGTKQDDGALKEGSSVLNLLPDLDESSIYNPSYSDYYGVQNPLSK